MPTKTDQIRELNDELRQHLIGGLAVPFHSLQDATEKSPAASTLVGRSIAMAAQTTSGQGRLYRRPKKLEFDARGGIGNATIERSPLAQ